MSWLYVFLIGGGICLLGQLLMDIARLTPAYTMCLLVVLGAVLSYFGIYQDMVELAGAGATTPISSFGNALLEGAREGMHKHGFIGILSGMYANVSGGIAAAVVAGFITAIIFKPKG